MTTYNGSCHCNAVTFTVAENFSSALRCNCSHCKRKGFLLAFVPASAITTSGAETLTTYRFNTKHIAHQFCPICGVQPFSHSAAADGTPTYAINLNCLTDLDLTTLPVHDYDGANR